MLRRGAGDQIGEGDHGALLGRAGFQVERHVGKLEEDVGMTFQPMPVLRAVRFDGETARRAEGTETLRVGETRDDPAREAVRETAGETARAGSEIARVQRQEREPVGVEIGPGCG